MLTSRRLGTLVWCCNRRRRWAQGSVRGRADRFSYGAGHVCWTEESRVWFATAEQIATYVKQQSAKTHW